MFEGDFFIDSWQVLFDMLRKNEKLVLPRLNAYFPRSGFRHENAVC